MTKFVVPLVLILGVILALRMTGVFDQPLPPPAPPLPSQPAEKRVVTYMSLADYTGPMAVLSVAADMGIGDFFQDLNERGGINGEIQVNLIMVEPGYDIARGVSAYKRYRTEPNLLLVNAVSTALAKAIMPLTYEDKVVQLAPCDGEFQAHIGWVFPWGPLYQNAFGATIDFILEDWKAKGNPGMPNVGYMSWDSAYGREPLRGGKEYAEQLGVNLLGPEYFPIDAPDHSVWLTRMAERDTDWCIIGGVDPMPAFVLRDARQLGLKERMQFIDTTYWGLTQAVSVVLHPEAAEGCYAVSYYLRGDEADAHSLAALAEKYHGRKASEIGASYVVGIGWGATYKEALEIALDDVGYDKLDGEAMLHAYESLTGVDVTQGIQGPCTYSPMNRQGSDMVKFYQVQNSKLVDASGWRKVPDCVALHDWSE